MAGTRAGTRAGDTRAGARPKAGGPAGGAHAQGSGKRSQSVTCTGSSPAGAALTPPSSRPRTKTVVRIGKPRMEEGPAV